MRTKVLSSEEKLLLQAESLLKKDRFSNKQILENLAQYNKSFEDLDESKLDAENVYHPMDIKRLAINYRLKFLDSKHYRPEIPYTAILKIEHLNLINRVDIKTFKILSPPDAFNSKENKQCSLLFVKTRDDNYYLIHQWGKDLPWYRKALYLPLRKFENLVITVCLYTLILDLIIPTRLITLDDQATYWSGYRAAAFFHLLIFNFGVTVYFTFTFAKNFSSAVWNQHKDF